MPQPAWQRHSLFGPPGEGGDREDLERDLADLRRRFDEFLHYFPDALVEYRIEDRMLAYVNRMATVLFGYTMEDLRHGVPGSAVFAEGEFERAFEIGKAHLRRGAGEDGAYERSGTQELYEFLLRRKDGSTFPAEVQASFVLDEDDAPVALRSLVRDITGRKEAEAERERLIRELQEAVGKVRRLERLLPICASCKKVRDDRGYWNRLEAYLREHSGVEFSHSICPECMERVYPELT